MKNATFILLALLFLRGASAWAQNAIQGTVLAKDNQLPLTGITVKALQSKQVALTDENGFFSMSLPMQTDTLLIVAMGFRLKRIPIRIPTEKLTIILEPQQTVLEEVNVSTGYYDLPKERATGSFTSISNEQLNRSGGTDILNRLKGVANGVSFDERSSGEPRISIRGLSTIYAETEPLIVLNGFPFDGDINQINPNDVENITLLKDAAAASIWGVRAANGVIVINTKEGALLQKPQIAFNANVSISEKPDVFYDSHMSSADFIDVERLLFEHKFYESTEKGRDKPPLTPAVELLILNRDGLLTDNELEDKLNFLKGQDVRNDFDRYWYNHTVKQQYALNMAGGTAQSAYYYSVGYDRNLSALSERYDRISLRADQQIHLSDKWAISPSISWVYDMEKGGKPNMDALKISSSQLLYPYARLVDDVGTPLAIERDYRTGFKEEALQKGLKDWNYVPLADYAERDLKTVQSRLLLGMNISYVLTKHLTAQAQYQYGRNEGQTDDVYSENAYFTRNLVNSYTQVAPDGTLSFPVPNNGGVKDQGHSLQQVHNIRAQLKYNRNWQEHRLNGLMGAELRDIQSLSSSNRVYGYQQSGQLSQLMDYTTSYVQYYNTGTEQAIPAVQGFGKQTNRFVSYYANLAYAFKDRYTLSASARKDASNYFGINSNQKAVPLWSAGIGWNLSKEGFIKWGDLDYLKLRTTYGFNGNLSRSLTALATVRRSLPSGASNLNNIPYGNVSTYPNADLRWEKVRVINIGADFEMFKHRLNGSLEYYVKDAHDLIGDQPIDPTVGIPSGTVRRNIANMRTKGLDVQLNIWLLNGGIKWKAALLYNHNTNKLTKYYNDLNASGSTFINAGLGVKPLEGKPVYNVMAYKWAGLDPVTGDPLGWGDGQPTNDYIALIHSSSLDDLQYFGSALPTDFGSLANTFSYKGLTLYLNVVYRFNYYFVRSSISYANLFKNGRGHGDFGKRWQQPGDEQVTDVPSLVYPAINNRDTFYGNSAVLVEKGDNIRLQDIQLSYALPLKTGEKMPFKNVHVSLNVRNVGILWKANRQGLDPDAVSMVALQPRIFLFGIKGNL